MSANLSKEEIIEQLETVTQQFSVFCNNINEEVFFKQPQDKWSIAQDVKHLITSADTTRLAFSLPKFIVRLYAGKPNRPSRTYDELVDKYKMKLEQGGRASGRYIPKLISPKIGKENLLNTYKKVMMKLTASIHKNWNDPQFDQYLAPHPLLGKITLRELCYFTIHHTVHHLNSIQQRIKS
jgi:hypothetical protein